MPGIFRGLILLSSAKCLSRIGLIFPKLGFQSIPCPPYQACLTSHQISSCPYAARTETSKFSPLPVTPYFPSYSPSLPLLYTSAARAFARLNCQPGGHPFPILFSLRFPAFTSSTYSHTTDRPTRCCLTRGGNVHECVIPLRRIGFTRKQAKYVLLEHSVIFLKRTHMLFGESKTKVLLIGGF